MVLESDKPLPSVSFLGPVSSYTHQATLQCFDSDLYNLQPADTITGVFEAVQSGTADLGVVPFENSSNGAVIPTLDLLADRQSQYGDITVCGNSYLGVSHYLLGHKATSIESPALSGATTPTPQAPNDIRPSSEPLTNIKHLQRIYTHPQAFGQCEIFLGEYLKGIERIDVSSTSKAAEIVKADTTGTSAAIASSLASEIYSLDVLAKSIEDRPDNRTRFLVLRKGIDEKARRATGPFKSLISFTVHHHSPGALADALGCFRRYHLNLTSINSRPTKLIPFQYIFFVEFEGSLIRDPAGDVQAALDEVKKHTQSCRWLGSWTDQLPQTYG
ncbi:hypothetical protein OIDMADRAFT_101374 [Oidiodendron maius Zn]|uniref:prephenate dehydratase n=1 Tax=Oidiodendron maius (strain Zn) TaxID=913774 RepID=A0A0C3HWY0_OIDMZ|nr:hypothetical protein OIDMADRAFT_101374 [Oidiodendron maius Zn]